MFNFYHAPEFMLEVKHQPKGYSYKLPTQKQHYNGPIKHYTLTYYPQSSRQLPLISPKIKWSPRILLEQWKKEFQSWRLAFNIASIDHL